jgi:hypothetical protein
VLSAMLPSDQEPQSYCETVSGAGDFHAVRPEAADRPAAR